MRRLLSALGAAVTLAVVLWTGTSDTVVAGQRAARLDRDYPVQPVSFEAVHLTDAFWAPKIETNRQASIQRLRAMRRRAGVDNFICAARSWGGAAGLRAPASVR